MQTRPMGCLPFGVYAFPTRATGGITFLQSAARHFVNLISKQVSTQMARFNLGENIELQLWTRDPDTDALFDPSSTPTLVVTDPDGTSFLASTAMTRISVGYFTYSLLTTANSIKGTYQIKYTCVDNGTTTIRWDSFDLGRQNENWYSLRL